MKTAWMVINGDTLDKMAIYLDKHAIFDDYEQAELSVVLDDMLILKDYDGTTITAMQYPLRGVRQ